MTMIAASFIGLLSRPPLADLGRRSPARPRTRSDRLEGSYRSEETAGSTSISRARPSGSVTSTASCWPMKSAISCGSSSRSWKSRPGATGASIARRPRRCSGRDRRGVSARDRRDRGGVERQGSQGRPLGPRGLERQPGAALLLRSLARQERREDADHPCSRQLQRVHRHRKPHPGRPDRHGPQRLDQLRRRHALEHHLRHQARASARACSWTACPA